MKKYFGLFRKKHLIPLKNYSFYTSPFSQVEGNYLPSREGTGGVLEYIY